MANWIQDINIDKGAFSKKAKDMNMSTAKLATKTLKKGSKAQAKTKKQAVLAQTFAKLRKKK